MKGTPTLVFEYALPVKDGMFKGAPQHKTWVSKDNGLLLQTIREGEEEIGSGRLKQTLIYSKVNEPITIEPPMN